MRLTKKRFATTLAATSVALLALTACGSDSGSAEPSADAAGGPVFLNAGKLTVCSDIPYVPFEFKEKDSDKIVGFDMDIAAEIAKDAKVELNVIDASFDSIESGLFKSQCDIAISSLSITEARAKKMNFSTPYLDDDLVLVAKNGSGITDLETSKDKKIGVQQATTGEKYAKEQGLTQVVGYEDAGLQTQALLAGQVSGLLGNQSVMRYSIKDHKDFAVVAEFKTGEQLGVGVPLEQAATLELVNGTLKRLADSGEMDKLKAKWFGEK